MTGGNGWTLPEEEIATRDLVRTGPSGLLLGRGDAGPVSVRLFAPRPTRVFLGAPDYLAWLLTFRCISMGAHVSIVTESGQKWQGLADAIVRCGGTVDLVARGRELPASGRPYRPSLIVDDAQAFERIQGSLGSWQAVFTIQNAAASGAVFALRNCDLALLSPADAKVQDNLRRAYSLTPRQLKRAGNLGQSEVVLAMSRRLLRLPVPPTSTEYRLLFGG
jgi:hypothetical protein